MSIDQNKAIVRRLIDDIWNTGDYTLLGEVAAPSLAQSTEQINRRMRSAFAGFEHTIEEIVAEGDTVVVRWTARGTHTGDLAGPMGNIPPTGKQVSNQGVHIFRLEAGKTVDRWACVDSLSFLQQLGVLPT